MPKKISLDINLVPKDPFFQTLPGRILRWALSVGRYIVIFTELVVIVSFVSRFSLDRQVTDLNKLIETKKNVIMSFGDLDKDFRELQIKIDNYKQVEQQANIAETFPKLTRIIPDNIEFDQLIISQKDVSLSGLALSEQALTVLITNMQLSPDFFNIYVSKIETEDKKRSGFLFNIRADTMEVVKVEKADKAKPTQEEEDEALGL